MVNLIIITFASAMWLNIHITDSLSKERCSSGLRGTPGKRVYLQRVSGVRIPLFPPFPLKKGSSLWLPFCVYNQNHRNGFAWADMERPQHLWPHWQILCVGQTVSFVFTSANLGLLFTLLQCLCGITPKGSLALVKLYLLHIIIVYSSFIDTKLALFDFL